MDIGTIIKRLRENKNISQTVLAGQLGIAQNTLGLIENGDTKKIDFLLMDKICKIFKVDLNYFIDEVKYKQVNKAKATGYFAETQNIHQSEKLIEQYELRIKDKEIIISNQIEMIKQLKELLDNKQ